MTKKKYFPRPDESLSDEENKKQMVKEMILWMADELEKEGNKAQAEELRKQANAE